MAFLHQLSPAVFHLYSLLRTLLTCIFFYSPFFCAVSLLFLHLATFSCCRPALQLCANLLLFIFTVLYFKFYMTFLPYLPTFAIKICNPKKFFFTLVWGTSCNHQLHLSESFDYKLRVFKHFISNYLYFCSKFALRVQLECQ